MNLCDQWLKTFYGKLPFEDYALLDRAVRTLESNSSGLCIKEENPWAPMRGIKPSNLHYFAGLWNWDCAFHAMAALNYDLELARDQVRIFLKIQGENGQFPDVWFYDGKMVFGCTKPPIFPWAACEIERAGHDDAFLKACCAGFEKNELFWLRERGGEKYGLFHYSGKADDEEKRYRLACCDSGWDNSPRWDHGVDNLFAIDLNCYMVIFYFSLAELEKKAGNGGKAKEFRAKGETLAAKIEELFFNESLGCYTDYDYQKQECTSVITPASFMPLFIGTASAERAEKMAQTAREHMMPGWPSVSYRDPAFDPMGYWRGRTWINIAYFAIKGLKRYGHTDIADAGRAKLLEWLRRDPGSLYENYDSDTGMPVGVPSFGWTAVFAIKLLLEYDRTDVFFPRQFGGGTEKDAAEKNAEERHRSSAIQLPKVSNCLPASRESPEFVLFARYHCTAATSAFAFRRKNDRL